MCTAYVQPSARVFTILQSMKYKSNPILLHFFSFYIERPLYGMFDPAI